MLKSSSTICYEIFRKISRNASGINGNKVTVKVHPKVADMMLKEEAVTINNLEDECGKSITIIPSRDLHMERYDILWEN